jgi:cellulose synthase/poly-beta-1,6-N-acetylglucosamine synthase-like glycosyltransferase
VLLPVYRNDRPERFEAAFGSVTEAQTRRPAQVIVVRDGPVDEALGLVLARVAARPDVTLVPLVRNYGLAEALNAGLAASDWEVVARQDADDLSRPDRFALSVPLVASGSVDVVGGALAEFRRVPGDLGAAVRRYPLAGEAIARTARLANPMAHPSVVFRRAAVRRVGGYRSFHHLEDYDLWVRLVQAGARLANLPEVLVDYRVSDAVYRRRGGTATLRAEWDLQREFARTGFITRAQRVRNVVVRGGFELAPLGVRRWALARLFAPA